MPLDPTAQALLAQLAAAGRPPVYESTVAEARQGWDLLAAFAGPGPELDEVRDLTVEGPQGRPVPVRLYHPGGSPGALVWFHGGGFVIGNIVSYDMLCRTLAARSGCAVVSVEYALAPEHPFPAGVDDCVAATAWVAEHAAELGIAPDRLAVGGDSAGGNLAAVVALTARDRGGPQLRFQLLVYPGTDWRMDLPSMEQNGDGYLLERKSIEWFRDHYLGPDGPEGDWRASPLRAPSVEGLPPALVITAEFDPIRDYGERYAQRLVEAGVPTTVHRYPGMIHAFVSLPTVLPAGDAALSECADALRHALARPATVPS